MKFIAFTLLFLISSYCMIYAQAVKPLPKKDSIAKADSVQRWKADSARISGQSPVRMNKSTQPVPSVNNPYQDKKLRSEYTYDQHGRITGGNTKVEFKNKKKDQR